MSDLFPAVTFDGPAAVRFAEAVGEALRDGQRIEEVSIEVRLPEVHISITAIDPPKDDDPGQMVITEVVVGRHGKVIRKALTR